MRRYYETFSRHRILLIAPLIISMAMAGWYVTSRPKVYAASTTVWFDTQAPLPSSIDGATNGTSPSAQAQTVLGELLNTRDFRVKVGRRGPLAAYFASRPGLTSQMVDDKIDMALQHTVVPFVVGPQVLNIVVKGPAPVLAAGTLQAVVDQFSTELNGARRSRGNDSLTYYQSALVVAGKDLATTEAAVTDYQAAHPPAAAGAGADPALTPLVQAALLAQERYTNLQNSLSQATLQLNSIANGGTNHVIDPPKASFAPLSSKKKLLFAGVFSLVLGALVSLGVLAALTAADTRARTVEDLEELGMPVAGTIGQFPRTRRHFSRSKVA